MSEVICVQTGYDNCVCLPRTWIQMARWDGRRGSYIVETLPKTAEWHCTRIGEDLLCYAEPRPLRECREVIGKEMDVKAYDVAWHAVHGYVIVATRRI